MTPDASIIVATYRRPDAIVRLCRALASQDIHLERMELVVVDDGSPQPVAPLLAPFQEKLSLRIHRQENSGPAIARNRALSLAQGRFILMTDDDCEPAPDWVRLLLEALEVQPRAMVGGHTVNGLGENIFSTVSQMVVDRVYAVHNRNPQRAGFFTSNNLGVGRELLLEMGAFDERYRCAGGEDRGLCDRWRSSGRPMIYLPHARIHHFHQLTLWRFWRQHLNYGRGALHYHLTRETAFSGEAATARQIVFDYEAWLREVNRYAGVHNRIAIVALLVLWQVANAAGYFWEMVLRSTPWAATGANRSNNAKEKSS